MLERVDRVVAVVTWLVAGILVVMPLFGPALVAHDQANGATGLSPYGGTGTSPYGGSGTGTSPSSVSAVNGKTGVH